MNRNTNTVLIILLVVLLFGAGIWLVTKNAPDGDIGNGGEESGMKAYTNSRLNISFEYPETYELTERTVVPPQGRHSITLIEKGTEPPAGIATEGPPAITLDFFDKKTAVQSLGEWAKEQNVSNFNLGAGAFASTTVDGVGAIRYAWDGLYRGETVLFEHDRRIIAASVTYNSPTDNILKDFEDIVRSIELK